LPPQFCRFGYQEAVAVHEMAMAEDVLEIMEAAAQREGFRRVRTAWLEIGRFASVEPEAMRVCFDILAKHSVADGARLEIIETPGSAWCVTCSRSTAVAAIGDPCPHCGGYQLRLTGGTGLRVKQLEVE
jgi:hydrogenase nickel incorporation protein HypA/HybF